ncbi:hypothetical protein [Mycobacterium lepromatosis]|uniref:hypothetical protein n=1 Tax=Mycobacterium lepromatosis TaxID=480418 RepID=UPI001ED9C3F0|nr:hypothetical protein [Mycobacterium lepromatosis]
MLIDIDELWRIDDEKWAWASTGVIAPDHTRTPISPSRVGVDASFVREFNMLTSEPVAQGFELPDS